MGHHFFIYMERYRSGHNGAVLKTVRVQAHVGSNPTLSAKSNELYRSIMECPLGDITWRSTQAAEEAPLLRE